MAVELAPATLLHHRVLQTGVSESNTEQGTIRALSLVCLGQSKAPKGKKNLLQHGESRQINKTHRTKGNKNNRDLN